MARINSPDGRLIEYRDGVHRREGRYDLGSLVLGDQRASLAFKFPYLAVRIDRNNQCAAQLLRSPKIPYVPSMYQVKTAVSQNDLPAPAALFGYEADQ
jgi:hypothetical protein